MTELAARRWAELQAGRGIPAEIVAAAPADPWTHDPRDFTTSEVAVDTPSRDAAMELLDDAGSVLDVGCGGGAAAFALERVTAVTGVDRQRDMLDLFAVAAEARAVPYRTVLGAWPEVAGAAGPADVVVCHHVVHNVVDLPPFFVALTAAAVRGVVVEMFAEHPMAWLDPLWLRFHGLHRPPSATVNDAGAVLGELGIRPALVRWERTTRPGRTRRGSSDDCACRRHGSTRCARRWRSCRPGRDASRRSAGDADVPRRATRRAGTQDSPYRNA